MSKFNFIDTVNNYSVQEFVEFLKINELPEFETIAIKKSIDGHTFLNGLSEFENVVVKKSIDGHNFLNLSEFEISSWKPMINTDQCQRFWTFRLHLDQQPEKFVYLEKKPTFSSKASRRSSHLQNENFLHSLTSVYQHYQPGNQKPLVQNQAGNDSSTSISPVRSGPVQLGKESCSQFYDIDDDGDEVASDSTATHVDQKFVKENKRTNVTPVENQVGSDSRNSVTIRKAKHPNSEFYDIDHNDQVLYDVPPAPMERNFVEETNRNNVILTQNQFGSDSRNTVPISKGTHINSERYGIDDNEEVMYDLPPAPINKNFFDEIKRNTLLLAQNRVRGDSRNIIANCKAKHPDPQFCGIEDNEQVTYDIPPAPRDRNLIEEIKRNGVISAQNYVRSDSRNVAAIRKAKHPNPELYGIEDEEQVTYDVPPATIDRNLVKEIKRNSVLEAQNFVRDDSRNVAAIRKAKHPDPELYGIEDDEQVTYDVPPATIDRNLVKEIKRNRVLLAQNLVRDDSRNVAAIRKVKRPMSVFYGDDDSEEVTYDVPPAQIDKNFLEKIERKKAFLIQNQGGSDYGRNNVPISTSKYFISERHDVDNHNEEEEEEEVIYDVPAGETDQKFVIDNKRIGKKMLQNIPGNNRSRSTVPVRVPKHVNSLYDIDSREELYEPPNPGKDKTFGVESDRSKVFLTEKHDGNNNSRIAVPVREGLRPSSYGVGGNEEAIYDVPETDTYNTFVMESIRDKILLNNYQNGKDNIRNTVPFRQKVPTPIYDSPNREAPALRPLPKLDPMLLDELHLYEYIDSMPLDERKERREKRKTFSLQQYYVKQRESERQLGAKSLQNIKAPTIQNNPLPPLPAVSRSLTLGRPPVARGSPLPRPPKYLPKIEVPDLSNSSLEPVARALESESYYRNVNRSDAERLLLQPFAIDGTYLVRPHEVYNCILSIKWGDKVYNIRINKFGDKLEIESSGLNLTFNSIDEIIEYSKTNPLSVRNNDNQIIDIFLVKTL